MSFQFLRHWALAVLVGVASPVSAAVIGYDDQGAFLGVSQDAYYGEKWSAVPATSTPVPSDLTAPVLPAIDPVILVAIAVLIAILLLSADNDSGSGSSESGTASDPTTLTFATPSPFGPFAAPPSAAPAPTPPGTQVSAVPIPAPLALLLAGLCGLALAGRRKPGP